METPTNTPIVQTSEKETQAESTSPAKEIVQEESRETARGMLSVIDDHRVRILVVKTAEQANSVWSLLIGGQVEFKKESTDCGDVGYVEYTPEGSSPMKIYLVLLRSNKFYPKAIAKIAALVRKIDEIPITYVMSEKISNANESDFADYFPIHIVDEEHLNAFFKSGIVGNTENELLYMLKQAQGRFRKISNKKVVVVKSKTPKAKKTIVKKTAKKAPKGKKQYQNTKAKKRQTGKTNTRKKYVPVAKRDPYDSKPWFVPAWSSPSVASTPSEHVEEKPVNVRSRNFPPLAPSNSPVPSSAQSLFTGNSWGVQAEIEKPVQPEVPESNPEPSVTIGTQGLSLGNIDMSTINAIALLVKKGIINP